MMVPSGSLLKNAINVRIRRQRRPDLHQVVHIATKAAIR
jgi:hypothetical protein